ncbi:MAG TPA: hypothetical protein VMR21_08670 [Vicinamibacteria bacterium]|nr:hypothetical protein [Vicinamibacteria bacterium]
MSTSALTPLPPAADAARRGALVAGGVGALALGLGAFFNLDHFFRSYLFAYLFWAGVGIGCLSILMIHHLTGGIWGLVIRRPLEAGARTLRPAFAILFLPLLLGLPRLYVWARPEAVRADPILQMKEPYLNVPFFIARAVFYFAVWMVLAHLLSRWSLELDREGSLRVARRLRSLAGGGLLLMGFTITFSAVDWGMSLNPHWFSTIYGILYMVGQVLSAMALMIVVLARLSATGAMAAVARPGAVHDLGKLLLAFVMLWAYVNVSQFLIIWSANLPEEIPFYIQRLDGGWKWVGAALVVFHFALPFLLLLSRDLKRNARLLGAVAAGVFAVRILDLFWLVAPDLQGGAHGGHGAGLSVHWMDVAALLALGGAWVLVFLRELAAAPLLPVDPELAEFAAEGH